MSALNNKKLLAETLAEGGYDLFKERLRRQALRELRRSHGIKPDRWVWALAACVTFGCGLVWMLNHGGQLNSQSRTNILAENQPNAISWIVRTTPAITIVRSEKASIQTVLSASIPPQTDLVSARASTKLIVATSGFSGAISSANSPPVELIDDRELLRLFMGRAVGFTRKPNGRREFFMVNGPLGDTVRSLP